MAVVVALVLLVAAAAASDVDRTVLCSQKAETGLCRAYIPSFFFNVETGKCETFIYGGCGGNDNRFDSEEECHATCAGVHKEAVEEREIICSKKAEPGVCYAYMPRYHYNPETGECEVFIYGGCGGNNNRFRTVDECRNTCSGVLKSPAPSVEEREIICSKKAEPGVCDAYMPRYHYNPETGECQMFIYGGCGGNNNRFRTVEECRDTCSGVLKSPAPLKEDVELLCAQKAETGPCRAYMPSYFYNSETGECEFFVYGGCRGNSNRFSTKEECHATCVKTVQKRAVSKEVVCSQEAQTGMCLAYIPSFFYNVATGKCESFIYGGCGGNLNRFDTEEQCFDVCAGIGQIRVLDNRDLCSQRAETGMCRAYIPSFFYNVETGKCESFIYGGCGGNENRFEDEFDCHSTCAGVVAHDLRHCFLEPLSGPCKENVPRYFFNRSKGQCEPFIYGGCQGNRNNWKDQKDCENHCLV